MNTYLNSSDVSIVVDIVDDDGNPLSFAPSAISYRLLDQEGAQLVAATNITPYAGEASVTILVGVIYNTLAATKTRGIRLLELTCTNESQKTVLHSSYMLEKSDALQTGINSYQTCQGADLLASETPNVAAWNASSRLERIASMIEAHERIGKLSLHPYRGDFDGATRVSEPFVTDGVFTSGAYGGLNALTAERFLALPPNFINAIRKAQIAEANYILDGDNGDHKDGLIAEKVGESAQTYKTFKRMPYAVCKAALSYVQSYLVHGKKLGRA